jgi:4-amino-4-deoxy-L-arabinose transferase-like glycosyltransferase
MRESEATMQGIKIRIVTITSIILYTLINAATLIRFPLMHSDESWIAGLTRHMLVDRSLLVTEPFFNLFPRSAHLIKSGFHLLQMPFVALGGYDLFWVRMLSLTFSISSLLLVLSLYQRESKRTYGIWALFLLMSNIEFVRASRFARQEIIMLFFFLLAFCYLVYLWQNKNINTLGIKQTFLLALIIGFSTSIHPNGLLLALSVGLSYLFFCLAKKTRFRQVIYLVLLVGAFAGLLAGLSLYFNPDFLRGYTTYGETMGVSNTLIDKFFGLFTYYRKIYGQIGATYYIPEVRFSLITGVIALFFGIVIAVRNLVRLRYKKELPIASVRITLLTLFLLGIQTGMILIGRYNTNYLLFPMVFSLLIILEMVFAFTSWHAFNRTLAPTVLNITLALVVCVQGLNLYRNISDHPRHDYSSYLAEINTVLDADERTLGNLNAGFHFNDGALLDYRDLSYLPKDLSLAEYLDQEGITAIILSEEMSYIARNQDPWRILYGPLNYYPELLQLIENDYELVHSFESIGYGMRIVRYLDGYPWTVQIYKKINKKKSWT